MLATSSASATSDSAADDSADAAGSAEGADVLHRIRSLPLDARSIAALLFHLEASGEEEARCIPPLYFPYISP